MVCQFSLREMKAEQRMQQMELKLELLRHGNRGHAPQPVALMQAHNSEDHKQNIAQIEAEFRAREAAMQQEKHKLIKQLQAQQPQPGGLQPGPRLKTPQTQRSNSTELDLEQRTVAPAARASTANVFSKKAVPVPEGFLHHFFLRFAISVDLTLLSSLTQKFLVPNPHHHSHCQATGGDQANSLYLELERMGFEVRLDFVPCLYSRVTLQGVV